MYKYCGLRALFICKTRLTYGNSYGLANSSSFVVNFLNSVGIEAKTVNATDSNAIDRLVTENNPDFVILEAIWVTPKKMQELLSLKRHKYRIWVTRIHSRPSFIAHEGIAFPWLLGYRELNASNFWIASNNREFAYDLSDTFGLQTVYLPNIYQPPKYDTTVADYDHEEYKATSKDIINIGCFGAVRPFKNHLTQAIACVKFANKIGKKLEFHINSTRMEQRGDQVLQNLIAFFKGQNEHTLIEHEWLTHKDFINLVRQMDIGVQVSLTETFNIVAADFVANNVPILGSKQIMWLPGMFQVNDANSTNAIYKGLQFVWSSIGYFLRGLSKLYLSASNERAKNAWIEFLDDVC